MPLNFSHGFSWLDSSFLFVVVVQLLSRVRLLATAWTAAHQASLSITNSWSLLKLMSIELAVPSNHLILCYPLLLLSSIFPSIRVFSSGLALLLVLTNISLFEYATVYLSTYLERNISQVLAIVNKAAINICMQVLGCACFQLLWVSTKEHGVGSCS